MGKNRYINVIILAVSVVLVLIYSCKKDEPETIIKNITGQVQKGPFVIGTTISMTELKLNLDQTGNFFTTQIINNSGTFEINNANLTSKYIEFSAQGYYFDEVTGEVSSVPLTLTAIADIESTSTVNVNILTHLERPRVKYLVAQGETFSEAKRKAQQEVLALFGYSLSEMDNTETLDITLNGDGNAILLAISIILQGSRKAGNITELLANISSNIREDGTIDNTSTIDSLRNSAKALDLKAIRSNLEKYYQDLSVGASIPNFEKYINDFLVFTAQKPESLTQPVTDLTTTGVTINALVNPNSLSTTITFEYGTTTDLGSSTPADQSPLIGNFPEAVSASLMELEPQTTYYYRVIAENSLGVNVGKIQSFRTYIVMDIDGNGYNSVVIGDQEWLTVNLMTTRYNDGSVIPLNGFGWYNRDSINYKTPYGAFYNDFIINDKLCPCGWRIPTYENFDNLFSYLGGKVIAGGKLKEVGTTHWLSPNTGATNETGFSAVPMGLNQDSRYSKLRIFPVYQRTSGGGGFYGVIMNYNSSTINFLWGAEFEVLVFNPTNVRCVR